MSIEDALQAELEEARAEIERLKDENALIKKVCNKAAKFIRFSDTISNSYRAWDTLTNIQVYLKDDLEMFEQMIEDGFIQDRRADR